MYAPRTPPGFGDQSYIYTFQPSANGEVTGSSYSLIPVEIQDAAFVLRSYSGLDSVLLSGAPRSGNGTLQLYDKIRQGIFQIPSIIPGNFRTGQSVAPERIYPVNSAIRFDITTLSLATSSAGGNVVPNDQMAFYGVRRFEGAKSDPEPSLYPFYEKDYQIPFTQALTSNGNTSGPVLQAQYLIQIQDYDFELRRIEGGKTLNGTTFTQLSATAPEFAITVYDSHWIARSNAPVFSNRICHFPLSASNPQNTWPAPGILYPVNSVIRIDLFSLIPLTATLPTIYLSFKGVRRIPCR
jgi:hypothetical protein